MQSGSVVLDYPHNLSPLESEQGVLPPPASDTALQGRGKQSLGRTTSGDRQTGQPWVVDGSKSGLQIRTAYVTVVTRDRYEKVLEKDRLTPTRAITKCTIEYLTEGPNSTLFCYTHLLTLIFCVHD